MRCRLCGNKTEKFFCSYHAECVRLFKDQWFLMGKAIDEYRLGFTSKQVALNKFIQAASDSIIQNYFQSNIYSSTVLRTYDKLVFSQSLVQCSEEKNRCHMERTGLSYAKYPQWQAQAINICSNGTIALSDSGIYIIGESNLYIPYGKVIDAGITKIPFIGTEVYFDVKTTSPHRHRYAIRAIDKKDVYLAYSLCDIIRFMAGIRESENKNHLIHTPPSSINLIFMAYPVESSVPPLDIP